MPGNISVWFLGGYCFSSKNILAKIPNSFTAVSGQFQDSFMYHSKVSMQSSRPLQTTA
jgi:hypothetical protein